MAVLNGSKAPHQPARPAAADERGEDVIARLAALARDHPDRAGEQRSFKALLGLEQPLGVQLLAQAVDAGQQIALAGDAHVGDREGEAGRGGGAAGVVVASAPDDDPHAVGERHPQAVEVIAPHRAGQRARPACH